MLIFYCFRTIWGRGQTCKRALIISCPIPSSKKTSPGLMWTGLDFKNALLIEKRLEQAYSAKSIEKRFYFLLPWKPTILPSVCVTDLFWKCLFDTVVIIWLTFLWKLSKTYGEFAKKLVSVLSEGIHNQLIWSRNDHRLNDTCEAVYWKNQGTKLRTKKKWKIVFHISVTGKWRSQRLTTFFYQRKDPQIRSQFLKVNCNVFTSWFLMIEFGPQNTVSKLFLKNLFSFSRYRPPKSGTSAGSILGFTRFPKIIIGKS